MSFKSYIQIHVTEIQSGDGIILFERVLKKCGFFVRGKSGDAALDEIVRIRVHACSS